MVEKFDTLELLLQKYPKIELGNAEDLTNFIPVNNLIPIYRVQKGNRRPMWACKCIVCNLYKVTTAACVKDKFSSGCCGNTKNLIGQKFGKLKVIQQSKERRDRHVIWICQCDCGNVCKACSKELLNGDTQSCGCIIKQNSSHGQLKIEQILKAANINFITQEKIITGNTYKYVDFCINYNNIKYFIQYDGKQHFLQNCSFGGKETLETIQKRDKQKNNYCIQNNIPLIRIPYTHYNDLCLEDLLLQTSKFRIN